jgi:hypothetical protein
VSGDGTLATFVNSTAFMYEVPRISFDDLETGDQYGPYTVEPFDMSVAPAVGPDAPDLAYSVPVRQAGNRYFSIPVISTFDGAILDELPEMPGPVRMSWLGNDTVVVCAAGRAPVLWRMYNGTTPIPNVTSTACPVGS